MLGIGALGQYALAQFPSSPTPPPAPIEPPAGSGAYPRKRKPIRPIWDIQRELDRQQAAPAPVATESAAAPLKAKAREPFVSREGLEPYPWSQLLPQPVPIVTPAPQRNKPRAYVSGHLAEDADTAPFGLPAEPDVPDAHGRLREADDTGHAAVQVQVAGLGRLHEAHDHTLAQGTVSTPHRANLSLREDGDQARASGFVNDDEDAIALILDALD